MFENKNTKQFNTLFSFLTFGLIGVLLITSLYILTTVMLFKTELDKPTTPKATTTMVYENIMYYSEVVFKDGKPSIGVSPVGAGLFFLIALSFVSLIGYCVAVILFKPNCLRKNPIIWTLALLSFSVFVMFILAMLGNVWNINSNGSIIKSFVLAKVETMPGTPQQSKASFEYGGASLTVLLFDIVIYCCLIISITHIIKDLVKLSKNGFVVNQELNVNL